MSSDRLENLRDTINELLPTLHKDVIDHISLSCSVDIFSSKVPFLNRGCTSEIGVGPEGNNCDIFFLTEKPMYVNQYSDSFIRKKQDEKPEKDKYATVGKDYYKFFNECIIDNGLKDLVRFIYLCNSSYKKDSAPENVEDYLKLYVPFLLRHIELFKPKVIICYSSVVWRLITSYKENDIIKPKVQFKGKYILLETPDEKYSVKVYQIKHPYLILEKDGSSRSINEYKTNIQDIIKDNFSVARGSSNTFELLSKNVNYFIKQKEKQNLAKKDKKVDIQIYRNEKYKEKMKTKNRNSKFNSMSKGTNDINKYVKKMKTEDDVYSLFQ